MECTIRIVGPRDKNLNPDVLVVNTTSRSKEPWSRGLSPFFLGPVKLYDGFTSHNVENAWQYAKVYKQYTTNDDNRDPTDEYWEWAKQGWGNKQAVRFPMGPGAKPEYSYWNGEKLGYVDARKKIYAPCYAKAALMSDAFAKLRSICMKEKEIYLFDFDGYDYLQKGMSLQQVIDEPRLKMGHAFVLTMLLKGEILWEADEEFMYLCNNYESARKEMAEQAERLKREQEKLKQEEIEEKRRQRAAKRANANQNSNDE